MRPNSASKKFWAEAVATDVSSVVAVMPVTSIPLTPRLKRVWRRINKAKVPPDSCADDPQAQPALDSAGGGRKYDLTTPSRHQGA
jgi:hypothetical protein